MSDVEDENDLLFAANSDIFDAELDSETEAIDNSKDGGQCSDNEELVIENGEEQPFRGSDSEAEESLEKIKQKAKKIRTTLDVSGGSPNGRKKRKAKKDYGTQLHSETQRLVRESRVKMPYHEPETGVIRQFFNRVTVDKNTRNDKLSKIDKPAQPVDSGDENLEISEKQPEEEDSATPVEAKLETVAKPKLSVANDSFFSNDNSVRSKTPEVNKLVQRLLKHNNSKLKQSDSVEFSKLKEKTQNDDVNEVTREVEKLETKNENENLEKQKIPQQIFQAAGDLRSLKEKIQANMKIQRAEVRKVYESQRKIDDEEISEEEEEDDFEEDEDSDFELDEWNADDEKAQEDRSLVEEKDETKDVQSNEESNSVVNSDTNHEELKSVPRSNHEKRNTLLPDERTIDLFPSDHSNQTGNRTFEEDPSDGDSMDSPGIKLRLDSLEDTQDDFTNDETSDFTKLKIPNDIHRETSDASNITNAQQHKSEMSKSSEILDRSSSNDGLTPFSRIQRLLSVDCSPFPREKSKPISELTLPVEDSQDLYEDDNAVDRRFGVNTSTDFNFALDEDTQFTQFVDTQGYLLSTAKKRRNKDTDEQKKSNNMSELLGLCSGTFSEEPKKKSGSEDNMNELLELCSGKFSGAPNTRVATESQDNMNELLGLCSGRFTNEKKTNSESENMSDLLGLCSGSFSDKPKSETQNVNELVGLCSGQFNDKKQKDSESQNMNELLGLCSGKFDDKHEVDPTSKTQITSDLFDSDTNTSLDSESREKGKLIMKGLLHMCPGEEKKNSAIEKSSGSGIFSDLGENEKRKPKSKQGLSAMFEKMGDEENSMDDVIDLCSGKFSGTQKLEDQNSQTVEKEESDIEMENSDIERDSDVEDNSENSEDEVFSDDEIGEEDVKRSKKYYKKYGKKVHSVFNKDNFVEDEAELSGSDASSDEEEGSGDDELEEDSDVEELPSDDELQRQVNKVHLRSLINEDKRELRELKERYLEDGDLYSEGGSRSRNFRWQGLEDSQLDMFDNKVLWGDDDLVDTELLSEAEVERRKMKHEKDQFLQQQLERSGDSRPIDVDENSQSILNLIRSTSSTSADGTMEVAEKPAPKKKDSPSNKLSQKRGSFLNRNKDQMSRLSSVTTMKVTPNSARGFVFHTVSPSSKMKENNKQKVQRSVSLSEPPNAKRPRLDRTFSEIATASLFAAMPV